MIVEGRFLISPSAEGRKYGCLCRMASHDVHPDRGYMFIFFGKGGMGCRVLFLLRSGKTMCSDF